MKITNISFITSLHTRNDTRMFLKECRSLNKNSNFNINVIVADNKGNEIIDGISIYDVGKIKNRFWRMLITTNKVFKKAIELKSDIYHLRDPEMIPYGLKLKKKGKRVIFDLHECIPDNIKDKEYLPKFIRNSIAFLFKYYEKFTLARFDGLLLAEQSYLDHYNSISKNCEVILNMPDISSLKQFYSNSRNRNELYYIGGVTFSRGVDTIIEAIKIAKKSIPDIFMHYIGPYEKNFLDKLDLSAIHQNIKFYGGMPLLNGLELSINAKIGLSILKPIDNHISSYSTKIFEYMAIGLPVITSNFELYKNVVETHDCGICVDPLNPEELAEAIVFICNNPEIAKQMGENGRKVVEEKFNWKNEELKLHQFYQNLLG